MCHYAVHDTRGYNDLISSCWLMYWRQCKQLLLKHMLLGCFDHVVLVGVGVGVDMHCVCQWHMYVHRNIAFSSAVAHPCTLKEIEFLWMMQNDFVCYVKNMYMKYVTVYLEGWLTRVFLWTKTPLGSPKIRIEACGRNESGCALNVVVWLCVAARGGERWVGEALSGTEWETQSRGKTLHGAAVEVHMYSY